jgi:hypothetical protein
LKSAQDIINTFVDAVEAEKLHPVFAEWLTEELFSEFAEWSNSLREVADAVDHAIETIELWRDAEDREDKAMAKEDALGALQDLADVWGASPLDLAMLKNWAPK